MSKNKVIYEKVQAALKRRYPKFEEIYKTESKLHRFLSKFTFWMLQKDPETGKRVNTYMTRYISVIGVKVAYPSRQWHEAKPHPWKILAHEGVHMLDGKRFWIFHMLGYGFPQNLLPLALLGLWNPWCWLIALCLLPWPSPYRAWAEFRGYAMNMAINYWRYGNIKDSTLDWIAEQFYGPKYYFMWPLKKSVYKRLRKKQLAIETGEILKDPWFAEMKQLIDEAA
jgi:hypothetical protein